MSIPPPFHRRSSSYRFETMTKAFFTLEEAEVFWETVVGAECLVAGPAVVQYLSRKSFGSFALDIICPLATLSSMKSFLLRIGFVSGEETIRSIGVTQSNSVMMVLGFKRSGLDGRDSEIRVHVSFRSAVEVVLKSHASVLMNFTDGLFVVSCFPFDTFELDSIVEFWVQPGVTNNFTPHVETYRDLGWTVSERPLVSSTLRDRTPWSPHRSVGDDACLVWPGPLYWHRSKEDLGLRWNQIAVHSWSQRSEDGGKVRIKHVLGGHCALAGLTTIAWGTSIQIGCDYDLEDSGVNLVHACQECRTFGFHDLTTHREKVQTIIRRSRRDHVKGLQGPWGYFLKKAFGEAAPSLGLAAAKLFTLMRGLAAYFRSRSTVKLLFDGADEHVAIRVYFRFDDVVNIGKVGNALVTDEYMRAITDHDVDIEIWWLEDLTEWNNVGAGHSAVWTYA
ncbi:hypothetical protein AAF712_014789 [Marasmius tenuissimus]|uniref:Uncharacterized protein n=1 Tax=Marasmius tenuissimus TaxID=585030 RepID=A0ABR2ZA34_9AGAR